jgi:hypothetical protein
VTNSRVVLLLLAACWLLLASSIPTSLHGAGIVLLLAVIALDLVLGVMTDWLAFLPTSRLDERQAALRDRAYRLGFRLLAAGVLVMVPLAIFGAVLATSNMQIINAVPDAITARHLAAFLELMIIGPTAVIAWLQEDEATGRQGRIRGWWSLVLVPLLAGVWFVAGEVLPAQTYTTHGMSGTFSAFGATCDHYAAEKSIAGGLAGATRFKVEVCWDGRNSWAFGDPSLHTPTNLMPAPVPADQLLTPYSMPTLLDLTSCAPADADMDFVTITERCAQEIGPDGTMHLTLQGRVSPLPGGVGARDVQIQLVVARDGKVLAFN